MKWYDGENKEHLRAAAEVLRDSGLIAFPTETVYGLGANGLDPEAVEKIYQAKGRPSDNPLILHIYDKQQAKALTEEISPLAEKAMDKFWPGPITLVLPKSKAVPDCVTGGLNTVAIRMPDHKIARALLRLCKLPIAAPSANLSGKPSPTTAQHVYHDLQGRIDGIVDGGSTTVGLESTVLDLSGEVPIILRPGGITKEMLEQELQCEVLIGGSIVDDKEVPRAPGMKYRHYAPQGNVIVLKGTLAEKVLQIKEYLQKDSVGLMLSEDTLQALADENMDLNEKEMYHLGKTDDEIAAHLFDALRYFDEKGTAWIISEDFGNDKLGLAIMNRLNKAAGEVKQ